MPNKSASLRRRLRKQREILMQGIGNEIVDGFLNGPVADVAQYFVAFKMHSALAFTNISFRLAGQLHGRQETITQL